MPLEGSEVHPVGKKTKKTRSYSPTHCASFNFSLFRLTVNVSLFKEFHGFVAGSSHTTVNIECLDYMFTVYSVGIHVSKKQ